MTECTCEAKDMPFGRCCKAPTLAEVTAQRDKLLEAFKLALQALEAIGDEMTFGERYTNAGQYLIDSLNPAREAIAECERK